MFIYLKLWLPVEWSMFFSKTSPVSVVWFVGHGFFLFKIDDNYNATQQTFVVKDLIVYEFWKFYVTICF